MWPWVGFLAHPGDGTPAAWTLTLLPLGKAQGLLCFCISGLYTEAALHCQPCGCSAPPAPGTQPPAPEPACGKAAQGKHGRDVDFRVE